MLTRAAPRDDLDEAESSLSVNLIAPLLGLIGIGILVYVMSGFGYPAVDTDELSGCADLLDGRARLLCYDRVVHPHSPAKGALAPTDRRGPERTPNE